MRRGERKTLEKRNKNRPAGKKEEDHKIYCKKKILFNIIIAF